MNTLYVGKAVNRVDGPAKVTGAATYAGEFPVPDLVYAYVVDSPIAKGKIRCIHVEEVLALPGVIDVLTHENRLPLPDDDAKYTDELAPKGSPFRPLFDATVRFSLQPVALVVAETFELARYAAAALRIDYEQETHDTELGRQRAAPLPAPKADAYEPLPPARGRPEEAWAAAPHRMAQQYVNPKQHNNPMEPFAATVEWLGDGNKLVVYDKTQSVFNSQKYLCAVFGLKPEEVHLVSKFTGGGFGQAIRPNYHVMLTVMAALQLKRSVRLTLTREQMFGLTYRPEANQQLKLGANLDGSLASLQHQVLQATSCFEHYDETIAHWSNVTYHSDNVDLKHLIAPLDVMTPGAMRAPGPATGSFAIESAIDELSYLVGLDPLEMRLRNYSDRNQLADKPFSSKQLRRCFHEGAAKFGWERRTPEPRSMREGDLLVGWGVASGVWDSAFSKTSARAKLSPDGHLTVISGSNGDIGGGTSTVACQIAAETLGLPLALVTFQQGESTMPAAPIQGGSWLAGSLGSAVQQVCQALGEQVLRLAQQLPDSPLRNLAMADVEFIDGQLRRRGYDEQALDIRSVLRAGNQELTAEVTAAPDAAEQKKYSFNVHNAVFVEVHVDEHLGTVRVVRVLEAVAAGRILNLQTARSQILGGIVWGIGAALMEETVTDHRFGRIMNHTLAEYHVPVNADIRNLEVLFVDEEDAHINPLGAKGVGEIGLVAVAAAVANAVYHATGKRIRELPITRDKLL